MTSAKYKSSQPFSPWVPVPSVMDRYITVEFLQPFLFGVGTFSSVLVSVGALFDLVRKVVEAGLPITVAINVFLLQLPQFVFYAFPMSTLLAALMTYSRLSSDSELIALRSCGVSIYRLVVPAIVLSVVITGVTFLFSEQVVPAANYEANQTLNRALKKDQPTFQEHNIFYPEYQDKKQSDGSKIKSLSRLFYADQFDGKRMKGLTIIDLSQSGPKQIVVADSAKWNQDQKTWDFFDGTIYLVAPDRSYRDIIRFEHQQIHLPRAPLDITEQSRDYGEMNIAQAQEQLAVISLGGDEQKIRKLEVRIQQKVAKPFVCIVFGLVGSALGTKPQRSGRATSFGISVLVIFAYYLLDFISGAFGQVGIVSPLVAAWLPNLFGFAAGGLLLIRAAR